MTIHPKALILAEHLKSFISHPHPKTAKATIFLGLLVTGVVASPALIYSAKIFTDFIFPVWSKITR
jgi:hypothetical protein